MNNKFITPILFLLGLASWPARGQSRGIRPVASANGKQQIKTEACNRCRPLLLFTYY